jgi:hypothetical protein
MGLSSTTVTDRVKTIMSDPGAWGVNPDVLSSAEINLYPVDAPGSDYLKIEFRFQVATFTEVHWLVHAFSIEDCLMLGGFGEGSPWQPELIVEGFVRKDIADSMLL